MTSPDPTPEVSERLQEAMKALGLNGGIGSPPQAPQAQETPRGRLRIAVKRWPVGEAEKRANEFLDKIASGKSGIVSSPTVLPAGSELVFVFNYVEFE